MKNKILSVVTAFVLVFGAAISTYAHPGRLDSNGGHYNRKTGEYHYHRGGGSSGGSSSKSSGSSSKSSSGSSGSSGSSAASQKSTPVQTQKPPEHVYASKINANIPSDMYVGDSIKAEGSVYPANAEDSDITWESGNPAIAEISESGDLTAKTVGSVIITAKTSRGTASEFSINVREVAAESITISDKPSSIIIGKTLTLSASLEPSNCTYKDIEWASDNADIISVDANGKLTAKAVGKATITALHRDLSDSFEIEVLPIEAESVDVRIKDSESDELPILSTGDVIELEAVINPADTTDQSIEWSVDDNSIAEIDPDGKLTAKAEGSVIVTATASNGVNGTLEFDVQNVSGFEVFLGFAALFILFGGIGFAIFALIRFFEKKKKKKMN